VTEQAKNGIRRRDLLLGSLAGRLASSTLLSPNRVLGAAAERADVIVIGGGLAGLNAATVLSD
jgi:heterodisulfide reductase subunit A-like polyferredoxin